MGFLLDRTIGRPTQEINVSGELNSGPLTQDQIAEMAAAYVERRDKK
jgi:hypothetical protein